jgi:hypothetical protein
VALVATGLRAGQALAAVLLYRLASFWLAGQAQSNTRRWLCGPYERQTVPTTHWIGRVVSADYADTGLLGVADVWYAAVVSDDASEDFWERHA